MAKSKGNFLTLVQAVENFTSDGVRVGCADAGDTTNDANFQRTVAENALMRLYNWIKQTEDYVDGNMQLGPGVRHRDALEHLEDVDKYFLEIGQLAAEGSAHFEAMHY